MSRNVPRDPKSSEADIREAVEPALRRPGPSPDGRRATTQARLAHRGTSGASLATQLQAIIDRIAPSADERHGGPSADPARPATARDPSQTALALTSLADWFEQAQEHAGPRSDRASRTAAAASRTPRAPRASAAPAAAVERRGAEASDAVAALQSQFQQVASELSQGLHRRFASEMEAVAAKIERMAQSRAGGDSVDALARQIGEMRDAFAASAGPERLKRLSTEVAALGRRIADLQEQRVGSPDVAAIAKVLEEIRASIRRSENEADATGLPQRLEALNRRLDLFMSRPEPAGLTRLNERLSDLAGHVESLAARSAESAQSLAARMDRRLSEIAEHVDTLARAGTASAQSLSDRGDEESARLAAPMQALSERLADLDSRLGSFATEIAKPANAASERMNNLAGRLDALASAAEPLAGLGQRMDERLTGLREELAGLPSEIAKPVDAVARRLDEKLITIIRPVESLADRIDERFAAVAQPLRALSERVDQRLADLGERLEKLDAAKAGPTDAAAERLSEGLEDLATHLTALIADGIKPVGTVAHSVERLSNDVSALSERLGAGPTEILARLERIESSLCDGEAAPSGVTERLDRLEECLREVGEHADTLPLEVMIRSLQERFDGLAASPSMEGLEERFTNALQRLNLTAAEPVQQALTEVLSHLRGLRGEAAMIAERAAKAALKDSPPLPSAADLDAMRQGLAELKAMQASAEKRTQATLKAVHNALETLVMRMPAGPSMIPAAPAPQTDSPAFRLEAAVRKLHAATLAHTDQAIVDSRSAAEEILLDPNIPRGAMAPLGASFTAPQEGEPGSVRASFIAAARRAAQAATAESASLPKEEAEAQGPISNQTLIDRIRQTFDSHRRPLLFGAALLMAAGSVQLGTGLRVTSESVLPQAEATPVAAAPERTATGASGTETTGSLLAPPAAASAELSAASSFTPGSAAAKSADAKAPESTTASASLEVGALAGDPAALFETAARLAEGRGASQDLGLAVELFQRAAESGFAPAQFRLANIYEKGVGVPRDLARARGWYEHAAAAGNVQAMHNLGVLFAEGAEGKPDYAGAIRWFKEASEHGVRDSQYNLAVLLARGVGTRQDLPQSYLWFALAAAQGDEDAGRKRDEVAARLAPADLASAKDRVARWRARPVHQAANEVASS
jgi:localization factor PodJL